MRGEVEEVARYERETLIVVYGDLVTGEGYGGATVFGLCGL